MPEILSQDQGQQRNVRRVRREWRGLRFYPLADDADCADRNGRLEVLLHAGQRAGNDDRDGYGWTQIDEGEGDRYRHAQNNYLLKPLTDERGVYRYKLVDGLVAQRTQAEMDADFDALPAPPLTTEERVNNVEQRTDALESANDDLILMMADLIGG